MLYGREDNAPLLILDGQGLLGGVYLGFDVRMGYLVVFHIRPIRQFVQDGSRLCGRVLHPESILGHRLDGKLLLPVTESCGLSPCYREGEQGQNHYR